MLAHRCHPCVHKFVKKIFIGMAMAFDTTGEDNSSAFKMIEVLFDLICSKDLDGGYCLLDPDNALAKMVNGDADANLDPAQMATWICNEGGCGNKFLDATVQMMSMDMKQNAASIAEIKMYMASGCFKNKDKYCMQYPQEGNVWDNVAAGCGFNQDPFAAVPATLGDTCSAGCSTAMETLSSTWGCCAMTMGATVSKEFNTALVKQSASCSVSMPGMCSGGKPLAFNIKVCKSCILRLWRGCETWSTPLAFSPSRSRSRFSRSGVEPSLDVVRGLAGEQGFRDRPGANCHLRDLRREKKARYRHWHKDGRWCVCVCVRACVRASVRACVKSCMRQGRTKMVTLSLVTHLYH